MGICKFFSTSRMKFQKNSGNALKTLSGLVLEFRKGVSLQTLEKGNLPSRAGSAQRGWDPFFVAEAPMS